MTDVTLAPKFMYPDQREATEGMFGNKYYWTKPYCLVRRLQNKLLTAFDQFS